MVYFYIYLATYLCYCIIKYREGLYYLKKQKYNSKKYLEYIKENKTSLFLNPEIISFLLIIVAIHLDEMYLGICTIVLYMILFLYKLKKQNKKLKIDKKIKSRSSIIIIIYSLVNMVFCLDCYINKTHNYIIYLAVLIMMTYLSYFVIYISNIIMLPFEKNKK